jgi:phosphoadenosine phosphosulfate reductase
MRRPAELSDVAKAIKLLQQHGPYAGCDSGGKDSTAIVRLAELAGVEVKWHYNVTTLDPPELIRFLRKHHPSTRWIRSKHGNLWHKAVEKAYMPTRRARWCCDLYKHRLPPKGQTLLMGIRHEESVARQAWRPVDKFRTANVVLPILHWDSEQLWNFIHEEKLPYCELYDQGFHRLGCVGCPLAAKHNRLMEFERWPKYEKGWRRTLERIWAKRANTLQGNGREWFGSALFDNVDEMWQWWVSGQSLPDRAEALWPLM